MARPCGPDLPRSAPDGRGAGGLQRTLRPAGAQPHQDPHARRSGDHPPLQRQEGRHALGADSEPAGCCTATIFGTPTAPSSASRPRARHCRRGSCRRPGARPPSPTCARPTTPWSPPRRTGLRTRWPCTATPTARARSAAWAGLPRTSGTRCRRWSSRHPHTPGDRRRNLYIGRHASHIVGEDPDESRALLERLCAEACRPPRIFIHKWQEGDLVLWDNRCVCTAASAIPRISRAAWSAPPSPATVTTPTSGWREPASGRR